MTAPTALITGSTDGIGKATALSLAKLGYSVHILGRNQERGEEVLSSLKQINKEGSHQFFVCDLSTTANVNSFLDQYIKTQSSLDVLVLNAGVFPKKVKLSDDGIDLSFSVGYISRYLFSVRLNPLLSKSSIAKVLHVNGSVIGTIKLDQLKAPQYGKMTSVWQNSVADALLCYHWKTISETKVQHTHWNPGIVNTQTVKKQSSIIQFLSKLAGMIEPQEAGDQIAAHIHTNQSDSDSSFWVKGKAVKAKAKIVNGEALEDLLSFSKEFTGINLQ